MGMVPLFLALAVGSSAQSSHHLFPAGTLTETEMQTIASLEQLVWQSPKPTSVSNLSWTFGNTKGAEAKGHKLTMLHRELTHPPKHPELVARLLQLAREADAKAGFGIVQRLGKSGSDLHIRVAESLKYESSDEQATDEAPRDGLGWHDDFGSLITMSIALSHKERYTGATAVSLCLWCQLC